MVQTAGPVRPDDLPGVKHYGVVGCCTWSWSELGVWTFEGLRNWGRQGSGSPGGDVHVLILGERTEEGERRMVTFISPVWMLRAEVGLPGDREVRLGLPDPCAACDASSVNVGAGETVAVATEKSLEDEEIDRWYEQKFREREEACALRRLEAGDFDGELRLAAGLAVEPGRRLNPQPLQSVLAARA